MTDARNARTSAEAVVAPASVSVRDARTSAEAIVSPSGQTAKVARTSIEVLFQTPPPQSALNARTSVESIVYPNNTTYNARTSVEVLYKPQATPKFETLQDNFNSLNTSKWTASNTVVTAKKAVIGTTTDGTLTSGTTYNLTSSYVYLQLVDITSASTVKIYSTTDDVLVSFDTTANTVSISFNTSTVTLPYVASEWGWIRFRADADHTTYVDRSSNGITWIEAASSFKKVVGEYWPKYQSTLALDDIPSNVNLVYIFQAGPVAADSATYPVGSGHVALIGEGGPTGSFALNDATWWQAQVSTLRQRGTTVLLTIGGSGAYVDLSTSDKAANCLASIKQIYGQVGGFDGLDFNIETTENGLPVYPDQMVWIAKQLRTLYGPDFIITVPVAAHTTASYITHDISIVSALNTNGVLTYIAPQVYDLFGSDTEAQKITQVINTLNFWAGYVDWSKLGVGFSTSASPDSNTMAVASAYVAYDILARQHPTIKGAFQFDAVTDSAQSWNWANTLAPRIASPGPTSAIPTPIALHDSFDSATTTASNFNLSGDATVTGGTLSLIPTGYGTGPNYAQSVSTYDFTSHSLQWKLAAPPQQTAPDNEAYIGLDLIDPTDANKYVRVRLFSSITVLGLEAHYRNGTADTDHVSYNLNYSSTRPYYRLYQQNSYLLLDTAEDSNGSPVNWTTVWLAAVSDLPNMAAMKINANSNGSGTGASFAEIGTTTGYTTVAPVSSVAAVPVLSNANLQIRGRLTIDNVNVPVVITDYVYLSKVNIVPRKAPVLPPGGTPRYPPPKWEWAVGDWRADQPQRELATISGRTLTVKLLDPDEASFSVLGDSIVPPFNDVQELVDDLHIWRNGKKLYRGRIGDSADNLDFNYTIQFTAHDYRDVLDYHVIYVEEATNVNWPFYDFISQTPEEIIWQLLVIGQANPNTDLGIKKGSWPVTGIPALAHESFKDGDKVWSNGIRNYVTSSPGVDFYIDPDKNANIYLQRGNSNGVVLDYPNTITKVQRSFSRGSYANVVRQSGSDPELTQYIGDASNRPEGSWVVSLGDTTLDHQEAVTQVGQYNYNVRSAARPGDEDISTGGRAYQLTFRQGAWGGPDYCWVGDTVRLIIKRGRLQIDDVVRVYEMSISLDQNNVETVTATVNWPKNHNDKLNRLLNTIWDLNRR